MAGHLMLTVLRGSQPVWGNWCMTSAGQHWCPVPSEAQGRSCGRPRRWLIYSLCISSCRSASFVVKVSFTASLLELKSRLIDISTGELLDHFPGGCLYVLLLLGRLTCCLLIFMPLQD